MFSVSVQLRSVQSPAQKGDLTGNQPPILTCTLASDLIQTASLVVIFKLLGIAP
jgi:hypothetical protein